MIRGTFQIQVAFGQLERAVDYESLAALLKTAGAKLTHLGFYPGFGHMAIALFTDAGTLKFLASIASKPAISAN